jgi:hypothetical protein
VNLRHAAALALAGWYLMVSHARTVAQGNNTHNETTKKITKKLDEIASRAFNRRDVRQLVDALRGTVSTIAILGAAATQMTPEERLQICTGAIERFAQELGP